MPTGQPDFGHHYSGNLTMDPEKVEMLADRVIREAIESGEFDDLGGTGQPLPGKGTVDDDMWWVRSWLERNREPENQESSNSE
jgi:hypothetical protein